MTDTQPLKKQTVIKYPNLEGGPDWQLDIQPIGRGSVQFQSRGGGSFVPVSAHRDDVKTIIAFLETWLQATGLEE